MKSIIFVGIVFIIFGIIVLAGGNFTYKDKDKVVDIGPIEATVTKEKNIPLSPYVGAVSLVGGIIIVIAGSKRGSL